MITVFKDASTGMPRWVAVTSNAYRDRDGEIVSSEALKKAVAYGDSTQERGPLRFWHVPGLDIGTTDFQATTDNGRFLVESGVITNPAMAKALQEKGGNWQMSIGFNHPAAQPDAEGVFKDISIFERSITPPNKAANPFTSFSVQGGQKMLTKEKLAALKELLGDSPELTNMLTKVAKTDKAAQDAGISFKEEKVADQNDQIAALEQRLAQMQEQLFQMQQNETTLKHYMKGSGSDGFGHPHKPGDYLDYGHDTSPDMIEIRAREAMAQAQKASMGAPMMNPYEMKGAQPMGQNPYEMKGAQPMGMMNPYEMKAMGYSQYNPYEMKGAGMQPGMMNPYEMKAAPMPQMAPMDPNMGMMPQMPPQEMKADDMGMGMGMGMDMGGGDAGASDMLLTAEEMTALADAVAERLIEKLDEINLKMSKVDEELKGRGYERHKEISETTEALEKLVEHAEATQDEIDALRSMNEELMARTEQAEQELLALKEATFGGTKTKSSEVSELTARAEQLEVRLKELEGDQPKAVRGSRPTESGANIVSGTTIKELRQGDVPQGLNHVEESAYSWLFK